MFNFNPLLVVIALVFAVSEVKPLLIEDENDA